MRLAQRLFRCRRDAMLASLSFFLLASPSLFPSRVSFFFSFRVSFLFSFSYILLMLPSFRLLHDRIILILFPCRGIIVNVCSYILVLIAILNDAVVVPRLPCK